ncbi:MAG: hypothetical protein E7459_05680 [Ruminococcaceae bacterium]|nr:hypothetical protein [Oscillospiraceae bacterium]
MENRYIGHRINERGDSFENQRGKDPVVKTALGAIQEALLPRLHELAYHNQKVKDYPFRI